MTAKEFYARLRAVREPRWFGIALIFSSCIPAAMAIGALASDILGGTRFFGSNPVKEGEHFLGEWTLRFLIFTLSVSPLRQVSGWNWLAKHRRTLGLFAFGYVSLHWLTYALLDVQLDWHDLVKDLLKRPYIYIGVIAMLLMASLAITSSKKMIRRLGGKRWNRLHKLIFVICILGLIHYFLAVKKDIEDPVMFALLFACLYLWRIWKWRTRRNVVGTAGASAPVAA